MMKKKVETWHFENRFAHNTYKCSWCACTIKKGTLYRRKYKESDPTNTTTFMCRPCYELQEGMLIYVDDIGSVARKRATTDYTYKTRITNLVNAVRSMRYSYVVK